MISFLLWYLIITVLGLATFPFAYRFLPGLQDRGYAVSRILGLLFWGYIFWLFSSLGILRNNVGGILSAFIMVLLISGWALYHTGWLEIVQWIQKQGKYLFLIEALFLISFAVWAFVRSANPEIVGTEKPMELAFLNAILRSPKLPPNDPWLSGYAISYYYFGYVLVAMIAKLTGTSGGVAFNLGVSLVFALSALGSYSIVYNLLEHRSSTHGTQHESLSRPNNTLTALLGPFFILIISNLGGFLQILRLAGVFWKRDEAGQWISSIWSWLDIGRYAQPPTTEAFPHWWWWQASRIVQDFDFNWVNKGDIIDEFPFFSFLLADLHPHVLAMPFAFLAILLALNLFLGGAEGRFRWLGMKLNLSSSAFILAAVVLGSMAFFNTWDFPFYVALFTGAYLLRSVFSISENGSLINLPSIWKILEIFIKFGFALGVSGAILYLPFYFTFQSQAGGPLPNLIYITRGAYLWLHFMPLLVPILGFLVYLWLIKRGSISLKGSLKLTLGLIGFLLVITLLLTFVIANLQLLKSISSEAAIAADVFLGSMGAPGYLALVLEGFWRRIIIPGTLLTLAVILCLTFALLWPRSGKQSKANGEADIFSHDTANTFTLLLILMGALLVLAPEFVFLRDLFGYRINTIFKFYFQVWLMWGVAAAYALVYLWRHLRGTSKILFQASFLLLVVLSLSYPVMGLWTKTNGFKPGNGFTLDGTAYLQASNPDEYAAMQWLQQAPLGVVAEAVGGSYTQFARMSSNSGQPAVLGWDFHELQWRGSNKEMGSRRGDIERLYCTNRWEEAENILQLYHINYVVVGAIERVAYGIGSTACPAGMNEVKFIRNLHLAFQQGTTSIYLVPAMSDVP